MIGVTINGGSYESVIGDLSFRTSEETLGMQVEFDIIHRATELVKVGDTVRLYENSIPFTTCKVIEIDKSNQYKRRAICFDYAFYLNKNEVVIQFKGIPADQAIAKLLAKYGIAHNITPLPHIINKIYKGETVSDIIKDILEQCSAITGTKYVFEMQDVTLVVAARNSFEIPEPFTFIMDYSEVESMQNMKNSIVIVSNNAESTKTYSLQEDQQSIKYFGRLQKVEEVDETEIAKATKIAKEMLKELNRIETSVSFSVLANARLQAHRIITVLERRTGVTRKFYVKSAEHTVTKGKHLVSLEVGAI